jgi:hypothetical protein
MPTRAELSRILKAGGVLKLPDGSTMAPKGGEDSATPTNDWQEVVRHAAKRSS